MQDTEEIDPFFRFSIGSRASLSRASEHLVRFEKDAAIESFFYAALNLRFGIEARLYEYLDPALKSIGQDVADVSEYVASRLLKKLMLIYPDATRPSTLRVTCEQDGSSTTLQFTPVTPRLAAIHGKLGELLHYKFFINNRYWLVRKPLGGNPHRSIADCVPLLREGIDELRQAVSGLLLSNPQFTALVRETVEDAEQNDP